MDGSSKVGTFHYVPILISESENIHRDEKRLLSLYPELRSKYMPGERPFELSQDELEARIEEMVSATFDDLSSTATTLDRLIANTRISEFVSRRT
jgi:hypothetical protein